MPQEIPPVGNDAPTPARIGTGRPMGRSHFSFGGERKVCKRKPAARRLREKALYCPFLKEGVRNVARGTVELPTWTFVRARAHSFPLSKRARLFPSAAYRRPRPCGRRGAYATLAGWDALMWHSRFSRATGKRVLETMLACGASRETFRRAAVCTGQAAGSHTRPASREACCRAAVKPWTTRMSLYAPARHRRAVRGAGGHPLLVGGFPVLALGDLGDEGDAERDNVLHDLLKEGGGPGGFLDGAFDDQLVVYL